MWEFSWTVCATDGCKSLFPKRYDRISACPRCGADSELPGLDATSGEYLFDCAPVRHCTPEVM